METESNILITALESMDVWKWFILGVVLLVVEMLTGTLFILWPAIASIIIGVIVAVVPLGWEMQLLLFAILTTAGLIWGEKVLRPYLNKGDADENLNNRAKAMIGTRVSDLAGFELGRGRVRVGDTEWAASMKHGNASEGQELRVTAVSGASVTVEAV